MAGWLAGLDDAAWQLAMWLANLFSRVLHSVSLSFFSVFRFNVLFLCLVVCGLLCLFYSVRSSECLSSVVSLEVCWSPLARWLVTIGPMGDCFGKVVGGDWASTAASDVLAVAGARLCE